MSKLPQYSQEAYKQLELPLFSSECQVSTGAFSPSIEAQEALYVTKPCNNPFRKNIVTCQDEFRDEFLDEVAGLDFNLALNPEKTTLPSYIPIFDRRGFSFNDIPNDITFIGTTLRDIITSPLSSYAGRLQEPSGIRYNSSFAKTNAFRGKQSLLFLTGPDSLIEPAWHQREDSDLYNILRRGGIDHVSSFNFSLFEGECAFAQGLNLKKSIASAYELENNGIRHVIPHIYALNDHQLNRWVKWLTDNPSIQYVTMNCQVQRKKSEITKIVYNVSSLLLQVPHLKIILQGYHFDELYRLGHLINRICIADAVPVKFSHSKRRALATRSISKKPVFAPQLSSNELAIQNIAVRKADFEFIKKQLTPTFFDRDSSLKTKSI